MRLLGWALRAFLFFTLFAFALNNQHTVVVHWFFGLQWEASMVIVVLMALGLGALLGVMAMVPNWWRARRAWQTAIASGAASTPAAAVPTQAEPAAPMDLAPGLVDAPPPPGAQTHTGRHTA